MKEIKTLIIDDEVAAVKSLRGMLTEFCPEIKIIAEAMSIRDALQAMAVYKPELVFLDIEMPPFSGFDFIEMTRQYQFGVVIASAYPKFAVEAINSIQPWAYIIKPYSTQELLGAVRIAAKKISIAGANLPEQDKSDNQSIVLADSRKGSIVLRVRDILYCKSDGPTLEIFTQRHGKTQKFVQYRTLKKLETQLPESLFCRVHHSFIVNLACVERFEISKRTRTVYLESGSEIPISIDKREQFERKITAFLQ